MTESEIEMAKFSMAGHKLAPDILEVEEYDDFELQNDINCKARMNYYNQMIEVHNQSSSTSNNNKNCESPTNGAQPPSLPPPTIITTPSASMPVRQDSFNKCDVYTQTYETKGISTTSTSANGTSSKIGITRANSSLSCFYMDPIDALVAIHSARHPQQPKRHSDPELASSSYNTNEIDSNNQTLSISHSLESLLENFRNRFSSAVSSNEFNSIRETILNERRRKELLQQQSNLMAEINGNQLSGVKAHRPDAAFSTIDSAWQWHSGNQQQHQHHNNHQYHHELNDSMVLSALKVPIDEYFHKRSSITTNGSVKSDITTVEDLISAKAPELAVPKITHIDSIHHGHQHLSGQHKNRERSFTAKSTATDVCTEFSEPWNSDVIESIFLSEFHGGASRMDGDDADSTRQLLNNDLINFNSFLLNQEQQQAGLVLDQPQQAEDDYDNVADDEDIDDNECAFMKRDDSEITLKDNAIVQRPVTTHPLSNDNGIKLNIAFNISNYVFELASKKDNTFSKSIYNFIECTKESTDPNPTV